MSEVKPCMNTECACHREGMHTVLYCGYYSEERRVEECPKYRDTAPAAPWEPLNPDDYVPGCCTAWSKDKGECYCCFATHSSKHVKACNLMTCYRPKKKPVIKYFAVVEIELGDKISNSSGMIEKAMLDGMLNDIKKQFSNTSGATCKIVEREVKK